MEEVKLNDLDYNILAILLDNELSGYDVTQRLKHFRRTSHPRIYTELGKLESLNYVVYRDVSQKGKPDKKLYQLTSCGVDLLRDWISNEKHIKMPKIKDDEIIRMLCLHLLDDEKLIEQLQLRQKHVQAFGMQILEALDRDGKKQNSKSDRNPMSYLHEMMQLLVDCDSYFISWLIENIHNDNNSKQSLREYLKAHL